MFSKNYNNKEYDDKVNQLAESFVSNIENGYYKKMILKNDGIQEIADDAIENFELWIDRAVKLL